jgi:hypothetical protein
MLINSILTIEKQGAYFDGEQDTVQARVLATVLG